MRTIGLICIAALAACGTDDGSSSGDDTNVTPDAGQGSGSGSGSGSNTEAEVNGKPASAFYAQFTHDVTHTNVVGAVAFAEQSDGRNIFLVHFFLMPNHELALFYGEGEGDVDATGYSVAVYGSARRARPGTWSIEGTKLVLGNTMSCDGITFNGADAMECTLDTTVITPAAQGRSGMFRKDLGASTPNDSDFAGYTP